MQNFIAQSMRRMGLAPSNKVTPTSPNTGNSGGGQAPLAHMEVGSKWSYSSLEYPMDIQSKTDMGHYMMFYINIANSSRSTYSRIGGINKDGKFNRKKKDTVAGKEVMSDDLSGVDTEQDMILNKKTVSQKADR